MKIAVVTPLMKSGERGGAEAFYTGLVRGLRQTSHDVDRIDVVIDESSFEAILASYEECTSLDLHDYDLVISTKRLPMRCVTGITSPISSTRFARSTTCSITSSGGGPRSNFGSDAQSMR